MMTKVLMEREFDEPLPHGGNPIPIDCCECFSRQRVQWLSCWITGDRRRTLLTCSVPDLESLRIALRHCPARVTPLFAFEEFALAPGAMPDTAIEVIPGNLPCLMQQIQQPDRKDIVRAMVSRQGNRVILLTRGNSVFPEHQLCRTWTGLSPGQGDTLLSLTQLP